MKHLLLLAALPLLLVTRSAHAQGVGVGTAAPDASAALDVVSTSKGLLVPRLTQAQRAAIGSPAAGLLVYQTDGAPGFYYNAGTPAAPAWQGLGAAGGDNLGNHTATRPLNLQGQALTGTGADLGAAVGVGVRADGGLNLGQNNRRNVLLGYQAGPATPAQGADNVFLGYESGQANTSGSGNVFGGTRSGANNTRGSNNLFLGAFSGLNTTTGSNNVSLGSLSGVNNTIGENNVFVGRTSGLSNTTGVGNVFLGSGSGYGNTTGRENVFSGYQSGFNNTTGLFNVFSGYRSGYSNTGGVQNVFSGHESGRSNTIGDANLFNGHRSGYSNTTGASNVFSGYESGFANTGGVENVYIGFRSGFETVRGSLNTALGSRSGPERDGLTNTVALGYAASVSTSNTVQLGNSDIRALRCQVGLTVTSDARFKYDVQADVPGLAFVRCLRPVTYRLDAARQDSFQHRGTLPAFQSDPAVPRHTGFLAQEVAQAAQALGFAFDGVHAPATARDHYGLDYARFVVPLVRAVQEQQSQIEALQQQNTALQARAAQTDATLQVLQAQVVRLLGQGAQAQK